MQLPLLMHKDVISPGHVSLPYIQYNPKRTTYHFCTSVKMDIPALIQQLTDLAEKGPEGVHEADCLALAEAATKVRDVFESPRDKMRRIMFSVRSLNIHLR